MRTSIALITALLALPLLSFGCSADMVPEGDAPEATEETEITATAEQAITGSQMEGIGRIFDTGASLGFAEFFASIINFSTTPPSLQVDVNQMNTALNKAAASRTGTFQAISSPSYSPPAITTNVTSYQTVADLRSGFHTAVANNSTYGEYYNLGANLAIAEAQASFAQAFNSQLSWQYSCWALDSALYSANLLKTRVKIDVNALSSLRNNVCNNKPAGASGSIMTLREQYATAVYATAEVVCGNAQCEPGETCSTCASDCGSCCGNGQCQANLGETCQTCASDCGSCCGNGQCQANLGETCQTCASDCGSCCGDGQCQANLGETCQTCASDCGSCCGNGQCQANLGETCQTCASDCGSCPCPNNPNGQPNNYSFCVYCPTGYGTVYATTVHQTGCTYQNAFTWVQGTTSSSCLIYNGACP